MSRFGSVAITSTDTGIPAPGRPVGPNASLTVGLAGAGWAEQHDIAGLGQVAAGRQAVELGPVRRTTQPGSDHAGPSQWRGHCLRVSESTQFYLSATRPEYTT